MPIGTAIVSASSEDRTVTHSKRRMPKRGWSPPTLHSVEVRKLASFFISEGIACESRNTPIKVTSPTTMAPAPMAAPPKSRSPRRPVLAPSPDNGDSPCDPGVLSAMDTPVTLCMSWLTFHSWR